MYICIIDINRGGKWNNYVDSQWYIDLQFTPLKTRNEY